MSKSIFEKMGIKKDSITFVLNPTSSYMELAQIIEIQLKNKLAGQFDYIHFFANGQQDMHDNFAKLKSHLKPTGMLWISWPKNGKNGTDLNIKKVIEIGYDYGLVESKAISIDETWSALKFTFPIEGKVYNNSYGKLK